MTEPLDRTQLTEALKWYENVPEGTPNKAHPLVQAARILLDFPTDEQVEAGVAEMDRWETFKDLHALVRAVLEAVRRSMFGDNGEEE